MGKRGPAPTPTALRLLKGDRKDRINLDEPKPAEAEVSPPAEVAADALALAEWRRVGPDLAAKKVLTFWDTEAFGDYCLATARAARCYEAMREQGMTVTNSKGETVAHPLEATLARALLVKAQRSARFGLTPSDRSQIRQESPGGKSNGEDLLTG